MPSMSLRTVLISDLLVSNEIKGNESLIKAYLMEQVAECKRLAKEIDRSDYRARRHASAKIAQELLSLQKLPIFDRLENDDPYKHVFRMAYQLSFPRRGTIDATWQELSELVEQLPGKVSDVQVDDRKDARIRVNSPVAVSPDEIIERDSGIALEIFETEIAKLTRGELEKLVVEAEIYSPEGADASDRDFLESGAAEITWRKFSKAYQAVMGKPFVLG